MEKTRARMRTRNRSPWFIYYNIKPCSSFYCLSIFLFSLCALFSTISSSTTSACIDIGCPSSTKADLYFDEEFVNEDGKLEISSSQEVALNVARRLLSGPGSSPPRCTSKCKKCTPCKPVHVPVPPGTPVTAEYYPEAWRCKCGNKLYLP